MNPESWEKFRDMKSADGNWEKFRDMKSAEVIDWKRFEVAAEHYAAVLALPLKRWTHKAFDDQTKRLGKTYSAGTLRRDLACLRVYATWLVREGLLPAVPAWKPPAAPPPRSRHLTPEEMRRILEASTADWFRLATRIAMASGQRIGAVLGLRWDQIANGIVDFQEGAGPRQKRRGVIPLLPALLEGVDRTGEWVVQIAGRQVHYHTYFHEWVRVCKRAGVEGATPHCIRHGVASALISNGVPLLEVSRMLGHSNVGITQRVYVKFDPQYTRRAAEMMAGML